MSKYLLAFHGGEMPQDPNAMQAIMSKWGEWMESLGSDMLDPGSIVGKNQFVANGNSNSDAAGSPLSGYMIISSDSIESAVNVANGCPILENNGSIEVAELVTPPE